jgi:hypothetical protein
MNTLHGAIFVVVSLWVLNNPQVGSSLNFMGTEQRCFLPFFLWSCGLGIELSECGFFRFSFPIDLADFFE